MRGSKQNSLQAVELSQRTQAVVQIVSNLPAPSNGGPIYHFLGNPGPTTLNKRVWICNICHKTNTCQKQISIRCNRIEHWVHLRCAGIRQAQYTDTWTCHLHRESRLTPHTDITPPHRSRPWSKPPTHSPPTPPTPSQPKHRHTSNTPPIPTGLLKPKPNYLIHSPPLSTHTAPNQTHTHATLSTNTSLYTHLNHVTCTRQNS